MVEPIFCKKMGEGRNYEAYWGVKGGAPLHAGFQGVVHVNRPLVLRGQRRAE